MALADFISSQIAIPILQVRVNGVLLTPSNATEDTGTPGVLSAEWDDTVARIDLNNCPTWMAAGQSVTIDAGLIVQGVLAIERQWTGFLLSLPGEDPDYLRDKVLVTGATIETGTPPDNIQEQITAAATLVGADIQPPLPSGVHIEHEVPNDLVWTSTRASWLATQYLERFGQTPRYPTGEPNRQTIICAGAMYKAARPYQLNSIDVGGTTDQDAIEAVLALAGIGDYSLIEPDVGWYTLADDAVLTRGRPLDMLQKLWELGQLQPVHTKAGVLLMRQVKWGPALTAAWEYDTTDNGKARILNATGELEVIWNPYIEKYSTGQVKIPFLQVDGRYFVEDVRHVWPNKGMPVTRIRAMGGSRLGGTVQINPVATFTYTAIREVFGAITRVIASMDASGSFDPDGSIASYVWSDNQGTSLNSETTVQVTVNEDTTGWTGSWDVTLTVTDNDGLTHAVTITIPYENEDSGMLLPATYVAHNAGASGSIDGNDLVWSDATGATCISVAAKPADGTSAGIACFGFSNGVIKRTTDACASALTTVYTLASGSAINYIAWDWRNTAVVWAASADAQILISLDAGVTWTVYNALRTKLGVAGAISGRRCLGLPGAGGIYWVGGTGAGRPMIAFDPVVGSHNWVNQSLTGDIATDFPADATTRIMDFTAPGYADGIAVVILEYASGGGGSIQPIYGTTSPPGVSAAYTRATGLTAGLKTGRCVVGDNPLTTPVFHAMFSNRDVWDSTDGIAWTQKANVLPAGEVFNDALFMSDVLTGIDGLFGVYMLATENAGGTLALRKSSDGIDTTDVVRGTGAASTAAPASYKPKMIAVGAPGAATPTSGQIGIITQGEDYYKYNVLAGTWTRIADNISGSDNGDTFRSVTYGSDTVLFFISRFNTGIGDPGSLMRSTDGGVTWTAVISVNSAPGGGLDSYGVIDYDIGPDGYVYALVSIENITATDDGCNVTFPLKVMRSTNQGASFSAIYTDTGYTNATPTITQAAIRGERIAINSSGDVILIGTDDNDDSPPAIRGTLSGGTWTFSQENLPLPRAAAVGASDQLRAGASGRFLWLQSDNDALQYSDNNGTTWTIATGYSGSAGRELGWRRTNWFNKNVAVVDTDVYVTEDNGATWTLAFSMTGATANIVDYSATLDKAFACPADLDEAFLIDTPFGTPSATDIVSGLPSTADGDFWIGGFIQ